jgi:hypothetical protein
VAQQGWRWLKLVLDFTEKTFLDKVLKRLKTKPPLVTSLFFLKD